MPRRGLDEDGLPSESGIYLVGNLYGRDKAGEIEVYEHPIKGLSCYCEDFGSSGTEGIEDSTDCHVSVQRTGLKFITKVEDLGREVV